MANRSEDARVRPRPDGRWDAWSIDDGREYLGSFDDEIEATRASGKGSAVEELFENMLADDLFTDDDGNPIKTAHRARPTKPRTPIVFTCAACGRPLPQDRFACPICLSGH